MRTTSAMTSTMRLRTSIMKVSVMISPPYSEFGNCGALGESSVSANPRVSSVPRLVIVF